MNLPTPAQLKNEFPLSIKGKDFIQDARETAQRILERKERRLAAIIGPCSIHDPLSLREYAEKLKGLQEEIEKKIFLILRFFIEKPRTQLGWKGLLYDPKLDGSNDLATGLKLSRKLWVEMTEMEIPCAMELLEPLVVNYFDDLIVWGMIGARTSASQPHRQMASGLNFPIGFKNGVGGELDIAISGIITAKSPHCHLGIDSKGKIAAIQTGGNPWAHLVLRGGENQPNCDASSVAKALELLQKHHLESRVVVDCSHGNSGKNPWKQREALEMVLEQENEAIAGIMLESHLYSGKQSLGEDPSLLNYGISITDPCIGWEETETLLKEAAGRSMSMSSVQK